MHALIVALRCFCLLSRRERQSMVRTIVFVFGLFLSISAAKAQMFSEFERAALIFTIAVANPSSAPRSIVQVGVRSRAHSTFNCLSGAHGLISLADYPVAFHVSKPETMIDADPILALPPKEIATFTISLYPNATGSCGYWSSIVSAVVKFDDGNTLETPSEMIDARQVESVRVRSPKREEVLGLAAHRSPMLRLQGIEKLPAVNVDTITAESVLRARYSDPVPDVREAAYAQSAAMKLTGLVPDLIARFDVVPKPKAGDRDSYSGELLSLCKAGCCSSCVRRDG